MTNATAAPAVGRSVPRREGADKVTGRARYTDDLVVPGAWYGKTIRSTVARGTLRSITLDPGFDWARVVVVTADDIPGENVVQLIRDDQPALARLGGEIRHQAEPILLLAAPDKATLEEAARHITIAYDAMTPVLTIEDATETYSTIEIVKGDVDSALRDAAIVVERAFRVGLQEQLYIEPQGAIAQSNDHGGITVVGSLQCPYYVHRALKRALALTDEQAVVIQAETGGGFGGKEEYPSIVAIHAALLARKAGRPVRLIYDRHEDLSATTKRHPGTIRHRSGVRRDGTLGGGTGHRDRARWRRLLHADAGRAVPGGDSRCRALRLSQRADPGARRRDQHAAERGFPRLRRSAIALRRRADGRARRRTPRRAESRPAEEVDAAPR